MVEKKKTSDSSIQVYVITSKTEIPDILTLKVLNFWTFT